MKTRSSATSPGRPAKGSDVPKKARPPRAVTRVEKLPQAEKLPGFAVGQKVPEPYSRLILYLPGGTMMRGVWTGDKWWAEGGEVFPERWEAVPHRSHR